MTINNGGYFTVDDSMVNHDDGGALIGLCNAVVKCATDDLLEAMLKENHKVLNGNPIIISTPAMQECNEYKKIGDKQYINGVKRDGKIFRFPEFYKDQIKKKFKEFKKAKEMC